jgi:hypothetical protein
MRSSGNGRRSDDPPFAAKVEDIVGLYMDPPIHAVVLSIDEKSPIQAVNRTQRGLPVKPGKCGAMAHDCKRNGTSTLFAALTVLNLIVVGRCMPKHRHQEFIKFLNAVEGYFSIFTRKRLRRSVFTSVSHLQDEITWFIKGHNRSAKPFVWTKSADDILEKLRRAPVFLQLFTTIVCDISKKWQ